MNCLCNMDQNDLYGINGGSLKGACSILAGTALVFGAIAVAFTAPVSVPCVIIAGTCGTAVANIGYWETQGWIKY